LGGTLARNVEFRTKNMTCLVTFLLKGPRKEREDVMKVEKKMNVWMDGKERCKV